MKENPFERPEIIFIFYLLFIIIKYKRLKNIFDSFVLLESRLLVKMLLVDLLKLEKLDS